MIKVPIALEGSPQLQSAGYQRALPHLDVVLMALAAMILTSHGTENTCYTQHKVPWVLLVLRTASER
jgi:hypothetical protein